MKKRDNEDSIFLNDIQNDEAEKEKRDESRRYTNVCHAWAKLHERVNTEKKHERHTRLCSNEEQDPRMMCIG